MSSQIIELKNFLPYLLNQAAESGSFEFQQLCKDRYGMLRAEFRVLFYLGSYGELTAKEICDRGKIHKTKISRAVNALEKKQFLVKREDDNDRRMEHLSLTNAGLSAFNVLSCAAAQHHEKLLNALDDTERQILMPALRKLAKINDTHR